jgi:hypothetical protein
MPIVPSSVQRLDPLVCRGLKQGRERPDRFYGLAKMSCESEQSRAQVVRAAYSP